MLLFRSVDRRGFQRPEGQVSLRNGIPHEHLPVQHDSTVCEARLGGSNREHLLVHARIKSRVDERSEAADINRFAI